MKLKEAPYNFILLTCVGVALAGTWLDVMGLCPIVGALAFAISC